MGFALMDAAFGRFGRYRQLRGGSWTVSRQATRGAMLSSLRCRVRGHDAVLVTGRQELYLRCLTCGWMSHGWKLMG